MKRKFTFERNLYVGIEGTFVMTEIPSVAVIQAAI